VETLQSGECVCVCDATGGTGVFIGTIGQFPPIGSGARIEVEGRSAGFLPCIASMILEYSSSLPPLRCRQV
jgi:hypothetical protein